MSFSHENATDNLDQTKVVLGLGTQLSAFGRLRVAEPFSLFDAKFRYGKRTDLFSESTASGGTVTFNTNEISMNLNAGATSGGTAIIQSLRRFPYESGKTQRAEFTANLNSAVSNKTKRIGLFDASNGVFFQQSATGLAVVVRSSISGSVVDTVIPQASWNGDKLDGTGPSGQTLDPTKQQLFILDYAWLGSGNVRFMVFLNDEQIVVHTYRAANTIATPYSQTGSLPFRMEVVNSGASSSQTSSFTCVSVKVEGGYAPRGAIAYASNGTTSKSIGGTGTLVPILSIRKRSSYPEVQAKIIQAAVFMNSVDDAEFILFKGATLTGATWGTNFGNFLEQDTAATAISGGKAIGGGYLRGAGSAPSITELASGQNQNDLWLGTDLAGASEILTIAVRNITSSSTAFAQILCEEAD